MSGCHETVVHFHPGGQLVALVGNPNCGKTALFNLLTGSRQKVANYAGVTVERKEGLLRTAAGKTLRVLDLPGAYSLHPRSPDERVTVDVLYGRAKGERRPDVVVCVVDATNLRRNLRLVLAVQRLGLPCIVALNMADMAARRGITVDAEALSRELGVPVVPTVGIKADGDRALRALLEDKSLWRAPQKAHDTLHLDGDHHTVQGILERLDLDKAMPETGSDRIDRVVLHPVAGPAILALLLFLVFQAVFAWAEAPMGWIEEATAAAGEAVGGFIPEGVLHSFVVDGLIAGLGGVVVFLPQILILFFFILLLEESGYLPRAAFLLDRLMGGVGLSGRSFIPLLSSFACAIPGIMATRTIADPRDRIVTILLAPMMTCSARLPVYALLIAAFIPARQVAGGLELQGLVLFALYMAGIAGAFAIAWVLKRFGSGKSQVRTLMMELPAYHWPTVRSVALGLWQRATIFLRRVGGVILVLTIVLWALSSFPAPPEGATQPAIEYSLAGRIGQALAVVFAPIGFNWQISIALVPAMGAREVAVAALATVYAVGDAGDEAGSALAPLLAQDWSMATALALMAWFVFAPQCLSTLATIKRETGGWKWPLVTAGYLFVLAYVAAFVTYRVALAFGL
ncbi:MULTISPECIES: ferrous iron transporter B [Rubrivivax]|uniref:Ferrous iron transport protein B n=1 Tax=Rubrivivax benzoatilyticus TaxID=316997 RepID=A0ABX0HSG7_9BURK|nr:MULTISPECIES: ferrous iron transporter B [Rubrivivax]EGJ10236.1 ferrous iron transport protein B [Rubrivivax benzoatilyticus JA2 = ATCC BAA-35]NHK97987.1 ferrous iron transporter B [Rubrivivax benzoatilyticus]NHL23489.1 ferrous iron transporter B [Rubrivivax benzoatilyticus]